MPRRSTVFELDIQGQEEDANDAKVVKIMPSGLEQYLTRSEWDQFCSAVDHALTRYTKWKKRTRYMNWAISLIFAALFTVVLVHMAFAIETKADSSSCNTENSGCNDVANGGSKAKHGMHPAIIILPLFVIILTVWGKLSLSSAHDESLNKVRQVCWRFSKTKPNMIVHLAPRYLSTAETRCDANVFDATNTRCNPNCHEQKLWYIEFWFSSRGAQSGHTPEMSPSTSGHVQSSRRFSYQPPLEASSMQTVKSEWATKEKDDVVLRQSTSIASSIGEIGRNPSTTDSSIEEFLDRI